MAGLGWTVTNWSELNGDLLSDIANRINCLRDFIIFGAVCRSWRSVASPENFNKSTKAPWLLLDREYDDRRKCQRKFLNLSKNSVYRMNLPKHAYTRLDLWKYSIHSEIKEKQYVYSSKGWFLNVENHLRLSLLNPFSLSRIDLPHLESEVLLNFALSSSPSVTSDFSILIAHCSTETSDSLTETSYIKLSFWKNRDHEWTDLDFKFRTFNLNITYYNGRFYIVDRVKSGKAFVVHEIDIPNSESVSISRKSFASTHIRDPFWIVESSRVLMTVSWRLNYESCYYPIDDFYFHVPDLYTRVPRFQFIVEEINFEKGECKKVSDLGDEALFLGYYSSFLVDVSNESRFKSNHIYFAQNVQQRFPFKSRESVSVYSMMDGSYKPLFSKADSRNRCSSQWIEPRP